jgi:hypothetical protein
MIIWLASYPKSGNTWLRFFIISLLLKDNNEVSLKHLEGIKQFPTNYHYKDFNISESDLGNLNKISNYWINAQKLINSDNRIRFFKTHNALLKIDNNFFTNEENTLGTIHIVRDPRNVISSVNNHYHHDSLEQSKKFIFDDTKGIFNRSKVEQNNIFALPQVIGSWKTHYNSWKLIKKNYLLVKYEDLIEKPELEFKKIANYLEPLLKLKFTHENISKAIQLSSFDRLKKIEEEEGFIESIKNMETGKKETFFNLGPKNDWKKILNKNISQEISKKFELEMKELGYLK